MCLCMTYILMPYHTCTSVPLRMQIPFYPGTPQHTWAVKEFANINRAATPWVFVMFHAPAYHTYYGAI